MNLKLVKKNNTAIDVDTVESLSNKLDLPVKFIELMYTRGITDEQAINKFLFPNESYFYDPFLMKGMKEATERLKSAIKNNERIVIYGDYDADGVCSAAILSLYFAEQGIEVFTHIPSRIADGYGLNTETIERIIEECSPDLILTCDCGISGYKEVEDACDLGVDVIVTDHHEVSDIIPNCIVIDPHQSDCFYPFEYLCGAGVALKLVEAMGGLEAAEKYLDLAAVATIADLVPLVDENRLIVQLGLKAVSDIKNIGLKHLLLSQNLSGAITSSDISFKIAPRINAAGRMGDAYSAFELFTTDNIEKIQNIINDINENNNQRKELCVKLYNEAIADLKKEDLVTRRCIMLSHPLWEKGITGIVAARLAGEFNRPSFILVKSGNSYKGTARSIPEINIYSLLSDASDLLLEFGGHSQAAGFSILPENIEKFKDHVTKYLDKFPRELFEPSLMYDIEINEKDINNKFVDCLDLLEPTGNSNTKPLFKITESKLKIQPCKSNISHTQITLPDNLQIFAFNNYTKNHFLTTEGNKSFVIELQNNNFLGREYIRGILKGLSIENFTFSDEVACAAFIKMATVSSDTSPSYVTYNKEEFGNLLDDNIYGTLIICGSKESYELFKKNYAGDNIILYEFMYATEKNNYSRLIVSPELDGLYMLGYDKIIFLDRPINMEIVSYINSNSNANVYVPTKKSQSIMQDVSLDRQVFAYYYDIFRKYRDIRSSTLWGFYKILAARANIKLRQFITCLAVFIDLGFISIPKGDFYLKFNKDKKADLNTSALYNYFADYKV